MILWIVLVRATDSAEEIEANSSLVGGKSDEVRLIFHAFGPITKLYASEDVSDSASESSSSSSSDSESECVGVVSKKFLKPKVVDDEDEDEGGAVVATVRTTNESSEPDIMIPPILQLGPDEQLERVGEIMNTIS